MIANPQRLARDSESIKDQKCFTNGGCILWLDEEHWRKLPQMTSAFRGLIEGVENNKKRTVSKHNQADI